MVLVPERSLILFSKFRDLTILYYTMLPFFLKNIFSAKSRFPAGIVLNRQDFSQGNRNFMRPGRRGGNRFTVPFPETTKRLTEGPPGIFGEYHQ
jgi:hypothetical protein